MDYRDEAKRGLYRKWLHRMLATFVSHNERVFIRVRVDERRPTSVGGWNLLDLLGKTYQLFSRNKLSYKNPEHGLQGGAK